METLSRKSDIDEFARLLVSGYDAWVRAGELVARNLELDPGFAEKVNAAHPEISTGTVYAFDRIGRKVWHPKLVLSDGPGCERLRELSFPTQERFSSAPVPFVYQRNGEWVIESLSVFSLSKEQAKQVIARDGIRNKEEQIAWILQRDKPKAGRPRREIIPLTKEASPAPTAPPTALPTVQLQTARVNGRVLGRWCIRKAVGNNCGFERTPADPRNKIIVEIGEDFGAVIEVVLRPKPIPA